MQELLDEIDRLKNQLDYKDFQIKHLHRKLGNLRIKAEEHEAAWRWANLEVGILRRQLTESGGAVVVQSQDNGVNEWAGRPEAHSDGGAEHPGYPPKGIL